MFGTLYPNNTEIAY